MTSFSGLTIHPATYSLVSSYIAAPRHSIVLHGPLGIGLMEIALKIAEALNPDPDGIIVFEPDETGKDVAISQIRDLYSLTKNIRSSRLTVIIDNAEMMSQPAQNAFLKLLEEPPHNVSFILIAHTIHKLAATIRSRAGYIDVRPISRNDSQQLIASKGIADPHKIAQLLFIGEGLPAKLVRLIDDEAFFDKEADMIRHARSFLQAAQYDRIVIAKNYLADREQTIQFIRSLARVLIASSDKLQPVIFARQLEILSHTIDSLYANANIRLQMTALSLSL